ncbi:MAG: DUF3467 domain-containing protein [Putridiphycobacter sp.]
MSNPKENQINIELTEEVASGTYSNLSVITHSHSEFVVDFVQLMPGVPKAKVKSRVILTPDNAKKLLHALADNVKKFEATHGPIKDNGPQNPIPMNFGPATEA